MSDTSSIWQAVAALIRLYLKPVTDAAASGPEAVSQLVEDATGATEAAVISAVTTLSSDAGAIVGIDPSQAFSPADVRQSVGSILSAWEKLVNKLNSSTTTTLLDYLTARLLSSAVPTIYSVLALLDVVNEQRAPDKRIDWDNLRYLWKPKDLIRDVYQWGQPNFAAEVLLRRIANALSSLGATAELAGFDEDLQKLLDPNSPPDGDSLAVSLRMTLLNRIVNDAPTNLGIHAVPIAGSSATDGGIALVPFGMASFPEGKISEQWSFGVASRGSSNYGVAFRPSGVAAVKAGGGSAGAIEATLVRSGPPWRMDLGAGFVISAEGISLKIAADPGKSFGAALLIKNLAIGVDTASSDGFLAKLLPKGGLNAKGDLAIAWSSQEGIRFTGGAGLELRIPLHIALGPAMLSTLDLGVFLASKPILTTDARLDIAASLGPLAVSVEGIGVRGEFDLAKPDRPADGAKLGPLRASVGFLAPRGAGLALEAGAVAGGGFLRHDEVTGEYGGIVNVAFSDLAIIGQGLIKPSADNFSMVIIVSVIFPTPIQLSFGFTLSGIGGLLGVHRTLNSDYLREGLKTGSLDALLFNEDPVANGPMILNTMSTAFPDCPGRFVIGPIFRIGWGTPNLIIADIGVMLEVPEPVRLVLIGQISALLPKPDDAVLELHLDVLGVLDFEAQQLSIDATIYKSKILTYRLYGDSALRWTWGNDKQQFTLAVGGVHPKYTPPPRFPSLRRLTLNLYDTDNLQLDCKMYQALTSNTVQFGARVELYASVSVASIEGEVGFDGLIQLNPFHFDIEMYGQVTAEAYHRTITSVKVHASVSGPTPWHVRGRASFHVLRWDPSVEFEKSWGRGDDATVPRVDPRPPLLEALDLPDAWGAAFPRNERPVETLAPPEESSPPADRSLIPVRINPAAELQVLQSVLPFEFTLERFGSGRPKNHNHFTVALIRLGGVEAPIEPVEGEFARSQFESLSEGQRLSGAAFVSMQAGCEISPRVCTGAAAPAYDMRYEQRIILADGTSPPEPAPPGTLAGRDLGLIVEKIAGKRRRALPPGLQRVRPGEPKVKVEEPRYGIVDQVDLRAKHGTNVAMSYSAAKAALMAHPGATIVPAFEVRP